MNEDLETCSWCTAEVPDSSLTEMHDGARICQRCLKELEYEIMIDDMRH